MNALILLLVVIVLLLVSVVVFNGCFESIVLAILVVYDFRFILLLLLSLVNSSTQEIVVAELVVTKCNAFHNKTTDCQSLENSMILILISIMKSFT